MQRLWAFCFVLFAVAQYVNATIIVNKSDRDFTVKGRSTSLPGIPAERPSPEGVTVRGKRLSKRERCCNLGKEVAKIGETCTYTENPNHIYPNNHYHKMKTSLWMTVKNQPIKAHHLQKCKRYKVFYEKCCYYEYAQIEEDLRQTRRKIAQYLRQERRNSIYEEGEQETPNHGESRRVSNEKHYEIK